VQKRALSFGGGGPRLSGSPGFFGLTVASFERGDVRQGPDCLLIYGDHDLSEVSLAGAPSGRQTMLDELAAAVLDGVPPAHDGLWGMANLEVCVAALESSRTRQQVALRHQVRRP
jgi:phthalate 4,5-cis-dihydrodiol dehydrogenase